VLTPVNCCIPSDAFGSALCVLEFAVNFKSVFDFDLPEDLSFGKQLMYIYADVLVVFTMLCLPNSLLFVADYSFH
jgi:hypothetical protein